MAPYGYWFLSDRRFYNAPHETSLRERLLRVGDLDT